MTDEFDATSREDEIFELVADLRFGEPSDFQADAKKAMPDITQSELLMGIVLQTCASILGEVEATSAILESFSKSEADHARREIARLVYPDWAELRGLLKEKATVLERVNRIRARRNDLN